MATPSEPSSTPSQPEHATRAKIRAWWTGRFAPGFEQNLKDAWRKGTWLGYLLEIGILILWGLYVGRAYLNLDPYIWPWGREFPSAIQTHYIWTDLFKCGPCVFWNGFSHGGAPAFADLHGSMLYPLVVLLTLVVGPLSGAKLSLVAALIMAGIAQWWLAKVMGFGRVPRLWSGLMAIVGGHLAGRMELGTFGILLSTAACSLVIAPGVALGLTGKRRYAILLGIATGLALLSGQGYLQFGLALSILPAFLVFMLNRAERFRQIWKEYLLAGLIAVLIAGVFLVPMLHFYPNVEKPLDAAFTEAQALKYIPLNHLIDLKSYFQTSALQPTIFPYLYINFLGWVPILLAIVAWRFVPRARFRLLLFFLTAILLVYLNASADTLKLLRIFTSVFEGVRNPSLISGLANPLILGLSAWGLEALLHLKWPRLALLDARSSGSTKGVSTTLLILVIPLLWSVREAYVFSQDWLVTVKSDPTLVEKASYLKSDSAEWVEFPLEHYWMIPGFDSGLKISNSVRTWSWRDRQDPPGWQKITEGILDGGTPGLTRVIGDFSYLAFPENEYAYIESGDQKIPCKAQAVGGNIDVTCPEAPKGRLIVHENQWSGWQARVDRTRTRLLYSQWLSVEAPAGKHTYTFRYRPWDVWVGIFLSTLGLALCVVLWVRAAPVRQPAEGDEGYPPFSNKSI
jgi:hypothetical protein